MATTKKTMLRCPACHEWFEVSESTGEGALCDDCTALLEEVVVEADGTR